MLPIAITTKDRPAYLDTTLRSLTASVERTDTVHIWADKPETDDGARILDTSERFSLQVPVSWYPNPHRCLPDVHAVTGVWGRFKVTGFLAASGAWGVPASAIIHAFERGADALILLQDDVVFKRGWYETMEGCVQQGLDEGYGVISFHCFSKRHNDVDGLMHWRKPRTVPAQCNLILRNLWDKDEHGIRDSAKVHRPRKWDVRLKRMVDQSGLKYGLYRPGICQHTGQVSQCWYAKAQKMEGARRSYKARVDQTVYPPYCGIDDVRYSSILHSDLEGAV